MKSVRKYVKNLETGKVQTYKNLSIVPIIGIDSGLEHLAFSEALESGFEIKEKASGSVPKLLAYNKTGKEVLAIAGEYIVGGMQNRTLVRNSYFSKDFQGELPVRCVQRGRWSYGDERRPRNPIRFPSPVEPPLYPEVPISPTIPEIPFEQHLQPEVFFRHAGQSPLRACLAATSQHETWNAIDFILCDEGIKSASADLNEVYVGKKEKLRDYKNNFSVEKNQVGNLAVIFKNGKETLILDVFDRPDMFKKYHENLISSYALEAGLKSKEKANVSGGKVKKFLKSLDNCECESQEPVSLGKDYKISGDKLKGSALIYEDNLVYMNVFSRQEKDFKISRDSLRFSTGFNREF